MTSLMRVRTPGEHARVGFVELFFDLVFVFAITQVSHLLLAHLTPLGALEAAILLAAVWWVWIDTSWITNWLDPERGPVRLMLFALMAAGLILSTSLPEAFGVKGLVFACAFASIQVGRSLFTLWAVRGSPSQKANFQRISAWALLGAMGQSPSFSEAISLFNDFGAWKLALLGSVAGGLVLLALIWRPLPGGMGAGYALLLALAMLVAAWVFRWIVFMAVQTVPKFGAGLYLQGVSWGGDGVLGMVGVFGLVAALIAIVTWGLFRFPPRADAALA